MIPLNSVDVDDFDDDDAYVVGHWPRGRELAAIAAFWVLYGALSVMNGINPPGEPGQQLTAQSIVGWGIESFLWMIATPPIFWLTSRFDVERAGENRWVRIALYVIAGLLCAFAIDLIVEFARRSVLSPPPFQPSGHRQGPRPTLSLVRIRYPTQCMVAVALLGAGIARAYVARYQRRREESAQLRAQLAEARLSMLRSQLNPHFLYNTLNAVSALVDIDPRGVRRMIARLSELLRMTLEPSERAEASVKEEIAFIERYLEILQIRFQGRLTTSVDIEPGVSDALVPPMILQPLVENAMKHAVSKSAAPSRIAVVITRRGEHLVLIVRDTGAPNGSANGEHADEQETTGVGLRNTRARLQELYGDHFTFDLVLTQNGATEAIIRVPYHTTADLRAIPASNGTAR